MLPISEQHPAEVYNGRMFTTWSPYRKSKLRLINTMPEWKAFFDRLMQQKLVACDTETSGFNWYGDHEVVGMSFGWDDDHFYIPVRHEWSLTGGEPPPQLDLAEIYEDLKKFFAQTDVSTIWHNAKFDMHFFHREGIKIKTPFHETRVLWHLFDENAPGKLKIIASGWRDTLGRWCDGILSKDANEKEKEIDKWRGDEAKARRRAYAEAIMDKADELAKEPEYQGWRRVDLKKHIATEIIVNHPFEGCKKEDIHYGMVPIPLMCEYAGLDTYLTWAVYKYCMKNLKWTKQLSSLYFNELKLNQLLQLTERSGIEVNAQKLRDLGDDLEKSIAEKELSVRMTLGDINLNSTDQLAQALIDHGIHLSKKTPAGKYQLDKKVLDKLKKKHQIVQDILDLRSDKKIKSTYVEGILGKLVDDHVLHCSFNQNVSTGRMSASNPNLMNIPRANTVIREAFPPPEDFVFVFMDYSQVEVRLTAHFSQDPILLEAYATGRDIHTTTMCQMFGYDYDTVTDVLDNDASHPMYKKFKGLRAVAKVLNFGIIYGVSAFSLSEQIERPEIYEHLTEDQWVDKCQEFIDQYMSTYKGVKRFIAVTKRQAHKDGQVTNSFGRTRRLPNLEAVKITKNTKNKWMERSAERQAVNYKIQGEAADIFKVAAVRIHAILKGKKSKLVNFVHDEVQLYIHKEEFDLLPLIKTAMEDFHYSVPLVVETEYSKTSWGEKKELKSA